jgi:hypothetical protein
MLGMQQVRKFGTRREKDDSRVVSLRIEVYAAAPTARVTQRLHSPALAA